MRCDPLPRSLFGEVGAAIPFSVRTVTGEGGVVLECPDNGLERWVAPAAGGRGFPLQGASCCHPPAYLPRQTLLLLYSEGHQVISSARHLNTAFLLSETPS